MIHCTLVVRRVLVLIFYTWPGPALMMMMVLLPALGKWKHNSQLVAAAFTVVGSLLPTVAAAAAVLIKLCRHRSCSPECLSSLLL